MAKKASKAPASAPASAPAPAFKGPWQIAKGKSVGAGEAAAARVYKAGEEAELAKVLGKDDEERLKAKGILIAAE